MRIVFAGSGALACPTLEALLNNGRHRLCGVITQPDRPKGRRLQPAPCPVRAFAQAVDVPVLTPLNVNAPESLNAIRALAPDVLAVVAYGQFLKSALLALPPRGCINLHTSLLPAYRGAAPIQWAIANGERRTGVTVMQVNERMDAGDILLQREEPIHEADHAGAVHERLARIGAELMIEALDAIAAGTIHLVPQDDTRATLAPKLKKADGRMDWNRPARELHNHVRGFNPWPGCYGFFTDAKGNDHLLKVVRSRVEAGAGVPGTLVDLGQDGPLVAAGRETLRLLVVHPAGGIGMPGADFVRGHALQLGDRLT